MEFDADVEVQVRHVQPYEAVKAYRCPGCDHTIEPGLGHEVVVPVDAPDLRRHFHSGCWRRIERERTRAAQRRSSGGRASGRRT
jgi:hypothetical protein